MAQVWNEGTLRVQAALEARGFTNQLIELPNDCRTSALAAAALGCDVAQIAKSLVFRTAQTGRPILVIASGSNRVDEQRLSALVAEPIEKPDADYVRQQTGFVIGGVAPIGHTSELLCFLDEDLRQYDTLWAAGGHPKTVFELTPDELQRMTQGTVVAIRL